MNIPNISPLRDLLYVLLIPTSSPLLPFGLNPAEDVIARILAIGPGQISKKGALLPPPFSIGDLISFSLLSAISLPFPVFDPLLKLVPASHVYFKASKPYNPSIFPNTVLNYPISPNELKNYDAVYAGPPSLLHS